MPRHSLTDDQKDFIRENYKNTSDKHLARKLHVPRHAIQRYHRHLLEEHEDIPQASPKRTIAPGQIKWIGIILFAGILLFSFNLRKGTFNLPHYRGDQHHYVGLAFKLDSQGIAGYSLRGINLYGDKRSPNLVIAGPAEDKGHVLKSLERGNITYYDEPLHHIPFGFPLAIMISHSVFAPGSPYFMVALPDDTEIIQKAGPGVGLRNFRLAPEVAKKQFYSIIIPLFFSLALISLVYFTAKLLYKSEAVALIAMFLMSISPIDILTSQKLWADDMTAALSLLAAFFYLLSVKTAKPLIALAAGLACGISAITKQSGAFIAIVIILWHLISNREKLLKKETWFSTLFDKNLLFFGLGCLLSAGYWFFKVWSVYGDPVYRPRQIGIAEMAKTGWFKIVGSRPKTLYLWGTAYQNPLFGLAYLSPVLLWIDKKFRANTLFCFIWIVVFLYIFQEYIGGGKELRYMLPAYPAYAILGAYLANKGRTYLDKTMGLRTGSILLGIILILSALWSIPMAMNVVYTNGALILKPY